MSKDDDIIKQNELEFNQFVATEDDLKELAVSRREDDIPTLPTSDKHGAPLIPVELETLPPAEAPKQETHTQELETDYNYVRNNIYTITERSIDALNNLSQIAGQSQHPRAYEVLSLLVKTIADAQRDLISIHKEKVKIETEKSEQDNKNNPEVINNNLFVGTTAQLDEIIAKMSKKKDA